MRQLGALILLLSASSPLRDGKDAGTREGVSTSGRRAGTGLRRVVNGADLRAIQAIVPLAEKHLREDVPKNLSSMDDWYFDIEDLGDGSRKIRMNLISRPTNLEGGGAEFTVSDDGRVIDRVFWK